MPRAPAPGARGEGRWSRLRRAPRGAVATLLLLAGGLGCTPEPPRHLVLVTADTWRGDHFGTERAGTPLTPGLSRFAAGGVRFTAAHSPGSETSPGTAGILTGLLPRRSGVVVNRHMLPLEVPTLAEVLRDAEFATAAVVANVVLAPGLGFDQGFQGYELVHHSPKAGAREVTDAALARLEDLDGELAEGRRLFLWVHYMDPHGPYLPPEEHRDLFPVEAFDAPRQIPLLSEGNQSGWNGIPAYQQVGLDSPSRDGRDYLARYAGEVHSLDREAARLLAALEDRDILETAVVVVTSDHGEALAGDHGFYFSHANGLTQDQIHVPLVVRCPGCPEGRVVERPVSTLGVVPTALRLLGVPAPEGHVLDGVDLLGEPEHPVYAEGRSEAALRVGRWKAAWGPDGGARLFDLARDPGEERDLAAAHPERLRELERLLRRLRRRPVVAEPRDRPRAGEGRREELRALGYL